MTHYCHHTLPLAIQDQAIPPRYHTGIYLINNHVESINPNAPSKGNAIPVPSKHHHNYAKTTI